MSTDIILKIILEDLRVCGDPAGDVGGDGKFGEGDPAGVDNVDEHESFLSGGVDEDVVGGVVGAFVGKVVVFGCRRGGYSWCRRS